MDTPVGLLEELNKCKNIATKQILFNNELLSLVSLHLFSREPDFGTKSDRMKTTLLNLRIELFRYSEQSLNSDIGRRLLKNVDEIEDYMLNKGYGIIPVIINDIVKLKHINKLLNSKISTLERSMLLL